MLRLRTKKRITSMKLGFRELRHNWKKYLLIEIIVFLMMFMVLFLVWSRGLDEQYRPALKICRQITLY